MVLDLPKAALQKHAYTEKLASDTAKATASQKRHNELQASYDETEEQLRKSKRAGAGRRKQLSEQVAELNGRLQQEDATAQSWENRASELEPLLDSKEEEVRALTVAVSRVKQELSAHDEETKDEMMEKLFEETMRGQGVQLEYMMVQESMSKVAKQVE